MVFYRFVRHLSRVLLAFVVVFAALVVVVVLGVLGRAPRHIVQCREPILLMLPLFVPTSSNSNHGSLWNNRLRVLAIYRVRIHSLVFCNRKAELGWQKI